MIQCEEEVSSRPHKVEEEEDIKFEFFSPRNSSFCYFFCSFFFLSSSCFISLVSFSFSVFFFPSESAQPFFSLFSPE